MFNEERIFLGILISGLVLALIVPYSREVIFNSISQLGNVTISGF
ncbi:hypothetical protein [Domibacillus indicus]|nr:hypothetical protein [Domibacillus indicus]